MRLAGIVPSTILQNRQSEEEAGELNLVFMVESIWDAVRQSRGCRPPQKPRGWQWRDDCMSRTRRRDAASDRQARFRRAVEIPAASWTVGRQRCREWP